jgi:DNA-directed RNA polymerase subunit L
MTETSKTTTREFTIQPKLTNVLMLDQAYEFTLSNVNVSMANSIRLAIESDIPCVVFYTDNYFENKYADGDFEKKETEQVIRNKCTIEVNTTRMHNELIKQRLSCIPIHTTDLDALPDKYVMELDVKNDTDNVIYVTTGDFKIKHKSTGEYMSEEQVHELFPKCKKTGYFIDIIALRPKISEHLQGDHLKLKCEFSVNTRRTNGCFSVTSTCVNTYTRDPVKIASAWEKKRAVLADEGNSPEEIEFEEKNFYLLDSQRYYVENSFDFKIKSVGVYEEPELVKMACSILSGRLSSIVEHIESGTENVRVTTETTMENSYDIHIEGEDYMLGYPLQYIMHELFIRREGTMTFCGFSKGHPFNHGCTIRVCYKENVDKSVVRSHLKDACLMAKDFYNSVYKLF